MLESYNWSTREKNRHFEDLKDVNKFFKMIQSNQEDLGCKSASEMFVKLTSLFSKHLLKQTQVQLNHIVILNGMVLRYLQSQQITSFSPFQNLLQNKNVSGKGVVEETDCSLQQMLEPRASIELERALLWLKVLSFPLRQ